MNDRQCEHIIDLVTSVTGSFLYKENHRLMVMIYGEVIGLAVLDLTNYLVDSIVTLDTGMAFCSMLLLLGGH